MHRPPLTGIAHLGKRLKSVPGPTIQNPSSLFLDIALNNTTLSSTDLRSIIPLFFCSFAF